MSAAAQSAPAVRTVANGFTKVPNSVITNIGILSHAELCLALVTLCKDSDGNAVAIDDDTWTRWTGLQARMKKYAVAGFARRKCFRIEGEGKQMRFGFDHVGWRSHVREVAPATPRPKTLGRKAGVTPKAGAKVHPDCFERGCSKLADQNNGLSLVPCSSVQPVAQNLPSWPPPPETKPSEPTKENKGVKSGSVQPVAQTKASVEKVWAKTFEQIQAAFPIAGVMFLVRLLAVIRAAFQNVTDEELANAVKVAYFAKKAKQRDEGLFLLTVPDALSALRKCKPIPAAVSVTDGMSESINRITQVLEARGAPFKESLEQLQALAERVEDSDGLGNYETLFAEIGRVESTIVAEAEKQLTAEQLGDVERSLSEFQETMPLYLRESGRQSDPRYREAVGVARSRRILAAAGVPRIMDF